LVSQQVARPQYKQLYMLHCFCVCFRSCEVTAGSACCGAEPDTLFKEETSASAVHSATLPLITDDLLYDMSSITYHPNPLIVSAHFSAAMSCCCCQSVLQANSHSYLCPYLDIWIVCRLQISVATGPLYPFAHSIG